MSPDNDNANNRRAATASGKPFVHPRRGDEWEQAAGGKSGEKQQQQPQRNNSMPNVKKVKKVVEGADPWVQAATGDSSSSSPSSTATTTNDEWVQAANESPKKSSTQHLHSANITNNNNNQATVKIAKTSNEKGKWGVKVDKNLFIADGCSTLQQNLAPFEPHHQSSSSPLFWKIVRVGASPIATFEQLKLALSMSGNEVEIGLVSQPKP